MKNKWFKILNTIVIIIWLPFVLIHELLHFLFMIPLLISKKIKIRFTIQLGGLGFVTNIYDGLYTPLEALCLIIMGLAPLIGLIPTYIVFSTIQSDTLLWYYFIGGLLSFIPSKQDFTTAREAIKGFSIK